VNTFSSILDLFPQKLAYHESSTYGANLMFKYLIWYFSIFYENKQKKKVKTTKNSSQLPDKRCSVMDIWTSGIYASEGSRPTWGTLSAAASIKP